MALYRADVLNDVNVSISPTFTTKNRAAEVQILQYWTWVEFYLGISTLREYLFL